MDALTVLQHKSVIQEFWREWFSAYLGREVFQDNNRLFIDHSTVFLKYIQYCTQKQSPCWMTVQPFRKRNDVAAITKLYFDFDCEHDLRKAWVEAVAFALNVKQYYNVESLLCFSGNKGYNVYIWLINPVEFSSEQQDIAKQFYKTAQTKILKGATYETLDQNVLGDIKRFSRVPYSIHNKSSNLCVPVSLDHTPLLVLQLDGYRRDGLNNAFTKLCLKQAVRKRGFKRLRFFDENIRNIRPCIQKALNKPLEAQGGHKMRIAIATEFLSKGYSISEVTDLFRGQPDFENGEKCRYYVEDIAKRGYKPFKCKTIRQLGFCLGEACPIFRGDIK